MEELTDLERQAVIGALKDAIDADRFPLSDRVKAWKSALAKLEGRRREEPKERAPPVKGWKPAGMGRRR